MIAKCICLDGHVTNMCSGGRGRGRGPNFEEALAPAIAICSKYSNKTVTVLIEQ